MNNGQVKVTELIAPF